MSPPERSGLLLKIADLIEANLERLVIVESLDNGKPIRETTAIDLPLAVNYFRYFAGVIRAEDRQLRRTVHREISLYPFILHPSVRSPSDSGCRFPERTQLP